MIINMASPEGLSMELVWENASPGSDFAAQTLPIDLSRFTHIYIKTLYGSGDGYVQLKKYHMVDMGEETVISHITDRHTSSANIYLRTRVVTPTSNGIVFSDSNTRRINTAEATTVTERNDGCIPLKIYGIKGVK